MPQSLAQLYVHLVFSTQDRAALIPPAIQSRLHAYMAGACEGIRCPAMVVGGVADHVHVLFRLARTVYLSDAVRELKVESSKWMKTEGGVPAFAWQAGYGAFSVGASQTDDVEHYIRHQAEHHQTRGFKEEFRTLLTRYRLAFDEAYVWD